MCETCGCGQPGEFTIHDHPEHGGHDHDHEHDLDHDHEHEHEHDGIRHSHAHHHHHGHEHSHSHDHDGHHPAPKRIRMEVDVLSENNRLAERNRGFFEGREIFCMNMVSSPGSGKTTILEKTIREMKESSRIFVIEGDQQTTRDAERIVRAGARAVQVNTGTGCHLDANMVRTALQKLDIDRQALLFIENVGNLVCPALFDLGEHKRVVVISVTEGEDKPLKYPYMFRSSHLCIINKSDLMPYVDFDPEILKKHAQQVNPDLEFILLSAKTGEGMDQWKSWISRHYAHPVT